MRKANKQPYTHQISKTGDNEDSTCSRVCTGKDQVAEDWGKQHAEHRQHIRYGQYQVLPMIMIINK
jgi:hypothetical protein